VSPRASVAKWRSPRPVKLGTVKSIRDVCRNLAITCPPAGVTHEWGRSGTRDGSASPAAAASRPGRRWCARCHRCRRRGSSTMSSSWSMTNRRNEPRACCTGGSPQQLAARVCSGVPVVIEADRRVQRRVDVDRERLVATLDRHHRVVDGDGHMAEARVPRRGEQRGTADEPRSPRPSDRAMRGLGGGALSPRLAGRRTSGSAAQLVGAGR
jgi:hypothetical protein